MVYNTFQQGDILSALRVGLAPIAYTDILLRSIWAIDKIRQTPIKLSVLGSPDLECACCHDCLRRLGALPSDPKIPNI